jgi:predicted transcriptional regulator
MKAREFIRLLNRRSKQGLFVTAIKDIKDFNIARNESKIIGLKEAKDIVDNNKGKRQYGIHVINEMIEKGYITNLSIQ